MPPRLARFVIGAALVVASPFVSVIAAQVPAQEYAARRAALLATVDSLVASGLPLYVVPDVHMADFVAEDSLSRGSRLVAQLRTAHPNVKITSLDSIVNDMRAKKTASEIALLRRAVDISTTAHVEAMKAVAPGCGEYEIQALMEGTFRRLGGDRPAYGSIVGSGPNANVLHYMADSRVMRSG